MNISLQPHAALSGSPGIQPITGSPSSSEASFSDAIASAISSVESTSQDAKAKALDLLQGGNTDIPAAALASQKAELSFELFQQVRNKFVSAYQEIMKMPM